MKRMDGGDVRAEADGRGQSEVAQGFRAVFDEHFGRLVGLARLLGSDDPEDTAAEAFVRLYRSWDDLDDAGAALAYVRQIVVRLTSNRRRHLAIVRAHAERQRTAPEPTVDADVFDGFHTDLRDALQRLTRTRRAAVVLRFYGDLPFAQVGEAMDCSESTARTHAQRGLADLRNLWNKGSETS